MQPNIPVGGTPLIPPSYLTAYFGLFFLFLLALYIYFYHKRKPVLLWQKVKLLLVLAFVLKATLVAGVGLLAAYWLIPAPAVRRTIPEAQTNTFSTTNKIEIVFDRPVSRGFLEKSISPETPGIWVFENSVYTTHLYRNLVFYPTFSLRPNTTYSIKLSGIRNLLNISEPYEYKFDFTTQSPPKVISVSPISGQREVETNSKIKVNLDNPNDGVSEFEFQFTPKVDFEIDLDSSKKTYTLTPKTALSESTEYNLKILKSDIILSLEDSTIVERGASTLEYDGNFATKQSSGLLNSLKLLPQKSVNVANITPENGWTAVSVQSPIKITFDGSPNHEASEKNFSIAPTVEGSFSWDGNTLIFKPKNPLSYSTSYTVTLGGTKSVFSTQDATTKLAVPAYLQKYTLSCEIASLRMALNFRGLNLSEDDIIPKVGFDTTPHNGNIWGNPYNAFVGNIKGTQMVDGYGVYWGPIARAARSYREAQDFEGWSVEQLTAEISKGNPVVIWVYSHLGRVTSWNTPDGTNIYAVRDEHAVVVVGFVGPANNPTQIIVNDPLIGQVYWSRATFDKKWNIFNRSGVVVY